MAADGEYGSADDLWKDMDPNALYQVAMYGTHAVAYQRWLRSNGLYLDRAHRDDMRGAEQLFSVKSRATAPPPTYDPTFSGPPSAEDIQFNDAMRRRRRGGPRP